MMPDASVLRPSSATDFDRIEAAIASLLSSPHQRLDTATLAKAAHLHEADWQALLRRWAGASPKQFWQSLTLEATQSRLAASQARFKAVSQAAPRAPQLDPPPVRLTAWTPDVACQVSSKLAIAYGLHSTQFGLAFIARTEHELCALQFCNAPAAPTLANQLQAKWPRASLHHAPEQTQTFSDRLNQANFFAKAHQPLSLLVQGTPFQIRTWRALLTLPFGSLVTYQDLADRLGNAKAARAVGTAIGANPIAYWIPCHRVIRASGNISGYRWGTWRKAAMLGWEACQLQEDD